jgi:hypothetical protein
MEQFTTINSSYSRNCHFQTPSWNLSVRIRLQPQVALTRFVFYCMYSYREAPLADLCCKWHHKWHHISSQIMIIIIKFDMCSLRWVARHPVNCLITKTNRWPVCVLEWIAWLSVSILNNLAWGKFPANMHFYYYLYDPQLHCFIHYSFVANIIISKKHDRVLSGVCPLSNLHLTALLVKCVLYSLSTRR